MMCKATGRMSII